MSDKKPKKKTSLWKPIVLLGAIVAIIIVAQRFGIGGKLGELRTWIEGLGVLGPVVFILLYVAATVAVLPGSALTVAAGALFGSLGGVVIVSIASTIGASLSFLVGRYFARGAVSNWLSQNEKFTKLDELTEKHGEIIVAITRLVPIFPFNLLNYGFGLTKVHFRTYVLWSWICMLPGTALYVVGMDAVSTAIEQGKIPWLLIGILLCVLVILTVLVSQARKKLC